MCLRASHQFPSAFINGETVFISGDWIVAIDDKEVHSNNFHEVVKEVENMKKASIFASAEFN